MTAALWVLFILALIPYVLAGLGGYYRTGQFDSFDNKHPRAQSAHLEGAGARAWAAQKNAWEALGLFTATVAVTHFAGVDPGKLVLPSMLFLVTRILHPILYVTNLSTLRSIAVVVGFAACIYMFVLAINA